MSMEMRVYFAGDPPNRAQLNEVMRAAGFAFVITAEIDWERQSGYLPMRFGHSGGEIDTGVEAYFDAQASTIAEFDLTGVDPTFTKEVSFRWGGDLLECVAAEAVSAAIATIRKGVVYEDEAGVLMTAEQTVALGKSNLAVALQGLDS